LNIFSSENDIFVPQLSCNSHLSHQIKEIPIAKIYDKKDKNLKFTSIFMSIMFLIW
jgi:hypothetical protein